MAASGGPRGSMLGPTRVVLLGLTGACADIVLFLLPDLLRGWASRGHGPGPARSRGRVGPIGISEAPPIFLIAG